MIYRTALHVYSKQGHKDKIKETKGKKTDFGNLPRSVINFFGESDFAKFKELSRLAFSTSAKLNTPTVQKLFKKERAGEEVANK